MKTINERISECIDALGNKKTSFANKLNVSQAFVSQLTKGVSSPSDRTIADICRVFSIDEQWLRTGKGEMFKKVSEEEELEQIFSAISTSGDESIKRVIRAYWRLTESEKAGVREMIDNLVEEYEKDAFEQTSTTSITATAPPATKSNDEDDYDPEIEAEVAEIRRQLRLEKKAKISRASTYGNTG